MPLNPVNVPRTKPGEDYKERRGSRYPSPSEKLVVEWKDMYAVTSEGNGSSETNSRRSTRMALLKARFLVSIRRPPVSPVTESRDFNNACDRRSGYDRKEPSAGKRIAQCGNLGGTPPARDVAYIVIRFLRVTGIGGRVQDRLAFQSRTFRGGA